MKEYTIFCIYNSGTPFILGVYNSFIEVELKLNDMIELENKRHRAYYVDNDFFDNKYNSGLRGKYFCIKEREVSEWEKYSNNTAKQKNKILLFKKALNS